MKTVRDVLFSNDSKIHDKINYALTKSGSHEYFNDFMREMSICYRDYEGMHVIVTDSFICSYDFDRRYYFMLILPINALRNVYRSCMVKNEYDFDFFHLVAEMNDGQKIMMSKTLNDPKFMNAYDSIIEDIRTQKAKLSRGGNL